MVILFVVLCASLEVSAAAPKACDVSAWSAWTSCFHLSSDNSCVRVRDRDPLNPSVYNLTLCGTLEDQSTCDAGACFSCTLTPWSAWDDCTCGKTVQRSRTIVLESNGDCAGFALSDSKTCPPCAEASVTTVNGSLIIAAQDGKPITFRTQEGLLVSVDSLVNNPIQALFESEQEMKAYLDDQLDDINAALGQNLDGRLSSSETALSNATHRISLLEAFKADKTALSEAIQNAIDQASLNTDSKLAQYANSTAVRLATIDVLSSHVYDTHDKNISDIAFALGGALDAIAELQTTKAEVEGLDALSAQVSVIVKSGGTLSQLKDAILANMSTAINGALTQSYTCSQAGMVYNPSTRACEELVLRLPRSAPTCSNVTEGYIYYDKALQAVRVCDGTLWRRLMDQGSGISCAHIKAQDPSAGSGTYVVTLGTTKSYKVYCDMVTDGGGWMLASTGASTGGLRVSADLDSVGLPVDSSSINQHYGADFYAALASFGEYQVMAQENSGPDRDSGYVMVYKLPKGVPLNYQGNVAEAQILWHTGNGVYQPVTNNVASNANFYGISADFYVMASSQRCTLKSDFSKSGGTNGVYVFDQSGTATGSTKCTHSTSNLGLSHWIRPCIGVGATCFQPGISCAHLKKSIATSPSGYYRVTFNTVKNYIVYCDMTTDGGGWFLGSTQKPDGNMRSVGDSSIVYMPADNSRNQHFAAEVYVALAAFSDYQVMVEENNGPDRDAGYIMMYKMTKGKPVNYLANAIPGQQFQWHIGGGSYSTVTDNTPGSTNWLGISCHGTDFPFVSSSRCTQKGNFAVTGGNNGDYKFDHVGTHSGTTRCFHGNVGIGVAHWYRPCGIIGTKC